MAHQLKITLNNSDPKIFRTVIVPEKFTIYDLHLVIQNVMNWKNYHLFQFNIGKSYASDSIKLKDGDNDDFGFFGSRHKEYDAEKTFLSDFFNGQTKKLIYTYDFGDDWVHTITSLKKPNEEVLYPKCIKGENAAPIEDCGGIWGFADFLETLNKTKKTEEDKEMIKWYGIPNGKTYDDIYGFNIELVNNKLLEIFKKKK